MKKIMLGFVFAALSLSAVITERNVQAQERTRKSKSQEQPKRAPRREATRSAGGTIKGAVIRQKTVRIKSGYEFVQQDANTVAVRHIATQATQGTFSCRCSDAGGCSVGVSRDTVKCVAGSCNDDCYVTVLTSDVAAPRKTNSGN